jgi:hypothetical protein
MNCWQVSRDDAAQVDVSRFNATTTRVGVHL